MPQHDNSWDLLTEMCNIHNEAMFKPVPNDVTHIQQLVELAEKHCALFDSRHADVLLEAMNVDPVEIAQHKELYTKAIELCSLIPLSNLSYRPLYRQTVITALLIETNTDNGITEIKRTTIRFAGLGDAITSAGARNFTDGGSGLR